MCSIMWHNFRVMLMHSYYKLKCSQVSHVKKKFQKYGLDDKLDLLDSKQIEREANAADQFNEAVATQKYQTQHKETIVKRVIIFLKTFYTESKIPVALNGEQLAIDSAEVVYNLNDSKN